MESALCAWLREPERAEAAATHGLAIVEEHGFPEYRDRARVELGWARAHLGRAAEGVALIREGVAGRVERGARAGITGQLTLLAEVQVQGGAIAAAGPDPRQP